MTNDDVHKCLSVIRDRAPGFAPRIGIVLGTGLGSLADAVAPVATIPYSDLPGFPIPSVSGHAGTLLLGRIADVPVALLHGRAHYYEHGRADVMKVPVRTLAGLGCQTLLLTNAAGSLRPQVTPGSVMLVTDHINFTGVSPLFGEPGNDRFVDMVDAYDPALRDRLKAAATASGVTLHEGVYIWFAGPSFETPAEIRAADRLGADAVGMSTVPEVVLARHARMKVAALSVITNLAAGMGDAPLSHLETLRVAAARGAEDIRRTLLAFFADGAG
ncbi:purine-nucleoside phosphorylase [Reyranella sp. CPCC 100927]|uniref:purine-nucleoside phosphorylase n=1 Tax=Reyranella sp. CPCC 100927 TaxID=2599616 RepID=UPI0011B5D32E|nr:purine-nucleoside phosphorylase [Reyranella sp. CPCC 100927]TWS95137.1 purine-nucleoside phosphorylase [Reyranella sp. CPCC 100927]